MPKNDQNWPKIGIFGRFGPGHAGLFSALLVGRLVVVARGLYLARHLFTLSSQAKSASAEPKNNRTGGQPNSARVHGMYLNSSYKILGGIYLDL